MRRRGDGGSERVGHSRSEKESSMVSNDIMLIRYFEDEYHIWL